MVVDVAAAVRVVVIVGRLVVRVLLCSPWDAGGWCGAGWAGYWGVLAVTAVRLRAVTVVVML